MNGFNLGDYVDVKERVKLLFDKWPNARIQEALPVIRQFDGREWIEITVTIHLGDDTPPVIASAWEPRGTTPYTKDSEQMNCGTSAVGRACGYLNLGIGKSLASRHEVELRRANQDGPAPTRGSKPTHNVEQPFSDTITEAQLKLIVKLARDKNIATTNLNAYYQNVIGRDIQTVGDLTKSDASKIIESLRNLQDEAF